MPADDIFGPFLAMLLLTLAVWVYMYVRRLAFIGRSGIAAQELATPERAAAVIPESAHYPAHNLRNLFELPVVFYALSLYLFVTGAVDAAYVTAGWLFFVFRLIHSVIHCTVNVVVLRFLAYMGGAAALWFMVLRAAWDFVPGA